MASAGGWGISKRRRHSYKGVMAGMLSSEDLGCFDLVLLVACGICTGVLESKMRRFDTFAISREYFVNNVTSPFSINGRLQSSHCTPLHSMISSNHPTSQDAYTLGDSTFRKKQSYHKPEWSTLIGKQQVLEETNYTATHGPYRCECSMFRVYR